MILNGVSNIPPATGINYSSWFAVGFVFQYWIRKKNFAWWSKFNYVASSALDSGELFRGSFFPGSNFIYLTLNPFLYRYGVIVDVYFLHIASAERWHCVEMVG